MSDLSERKEAAVRQKIALLHGEFEYWRLETREHSEFEKHQSQVVALTAHLQGLSARTQQMFDHAVAQGTLLIQGRNIEALVLGLMRIWEVFRAKFAQRRDPRMRRFLQAADELAWSCYKPILDLMPQARRQPPLVFLNGGLSPYALSRDRAFAAESVPGEPLDGRAYDTLLQRLPIAMIGVPWYQVGHLPDLPVVAHETGHAVENDFGLHPVVLANLEAELGQGHPHLSHWRSWSSEAFADLWGTLSLGPAYLSSLADFLATDPKVVGGEIPDDRDRYPTVHIRLCLCLSALRRMGFVEEAQHISALWHERYGDPIADEWLRDVDQVVEAMLWHPLAPVGCCLIDVPNARLTTDGWDMACDAADQLLARNDPMGSATTIVRWAAAARRVYDLSPSQYVGQACGERLLDYSVQLINPGTRYGERALGAGGLRALDNGSVQDGVDAFDDFARWATVPM